jgi:hypothetical protein
MIRRRKTKRLSRSRRIKKVTSGRSAQLTVSYNQPDSTRALQIEVRWSAYPEDVKPPAFLNALAREPGVLKVDWSFSD